MSKARSSSLSVSVSIEFPFGEGAVAIHYPSIPARQIAPPQRRRFPPNEVLLPLVEQAAEPEHRLPVIGGIIAMATQAEAGDQRMIRSADKCHPITKTHGPGGH